MKNISSCIGIDKWRNMNVILIYLYIGVPIGSLRFCIYAEYAVSRIKHIHIQYYVLLW